MKKFPLISSIAFLAFGLFSNFCSSQGQVEEPGFAGDHFSLESALELFKNSDNLEDFEKKLNAEDSKANNLDLNEDGNIDYIRVIDNMETSVHAIVLQAVLGENEFQDIAVIEIERSRDDYAILQIVGDEDVFGEQTIVEPFDEGSEGDGKGPNALNEYPMRVVVNVYAWPSVHYLYRPNYVRYVSPWKWLYYPNGWRPWRPLSWSVWHPFRNAYRNHYHVVTVHRVSRAHKVYSPHRRSNTVVVNKTKVQRTRVSTSKTSTAVISKDANGNKAVGVKNTKTKEVTGQKGNAVEKSKTKSKVTAKTDKGKVKAEKKTKTTKVKKKNN